ncbi:MAG: type I-A CRISPR-associated protein Cas5a [Candidatus Korarchaeum sp.]
MSYPAFIVDLEFVWGFQARIVGLSKTSPSFHYPPPTTFLGALGHSIARELGVGESSGGEIIARLGRKLLALGVRPVNCVPLVYEDLSRILAVKVTSGVLYPDPRNLAGSYDSPARGKTAMMSLDDKAPTLRFALIFKEDFMDFNGKSVKIGEDHFWKIHRIGSKESRVSVVNVERLEARLSQKKVSSTYYSFPVSKYVTPKEEIQSKWLYEVYIDPRSVSYTSRENPFLSYSGGRLLPYRIPIMVSRFDPPEYMLEVMAPVLYELEGEVIVGWSE